MSHPQPKLPPLAAPDVAAGHLTHLPGTEASARPRRTPRAACCLAARALHAKQSCYQSPVSRDERSGQPWRNRPRRVGLELGAGAGVGLRGWDALVGVLSEPGGPVSAGHGLPGALGSASHADQDECFPAPDTAALSRTCGRLRTAYPATPGWKGQGSQSSPRTHLPSTPCLLYGWDTRPRPDTAEAAQRPGRKLRSARGGKCGGGGR